MHTQCLTCGHVIYDKGAIPWPPPARERIAEARLESDRHRYFIRCTACGKRNFFIKEYAYSRAVLRQSHAED